MFRIYKDFIEGVTEGAEVSVLAEIPDIENGIIEPFEAD